MFYFILVENKKIKCSVKLSFIYMIGVNHIITYKIKYRKYRIYFWNQKQNHSQQKQQKMFRLRHDQGYLYREIFHY